MSREKTRVGHVELGAVRRIGHRHAVVLLPVEAKVVDMNAQRVALERVDARLESLKRELRSLERQRTAIADTITQFENLPIERDDGDPEVPQEARVVEPEKRERRARPEPDKNPGV